MTEEVFKIENVAVSTRMRLARNLAGYPFPNCLKSLKQAREIVLLTADALKEAEVFKLYYMNSISKEKAAFLKERYLISEDLIAASRISAALVSHDESISVMVNEEDHIREQYFTKGFDLGKAYERISGIDEILSEHIAFAFDKQLGFLTACPTNLGTGLRASVMLYLPAITRANLMRRIANELKAQGLTVRGAFGEGSDAVGQMYQISNEATLGISEEKIISVVQDEVMRIVGIELIEREKLLVKRDVSTIDCIMRSYGVLTNCVSIDEREFITRMSDVKLALSLGYMEGHMEELDDLIVAMRPANINRLNGAPLSEEDQDIYRAEYAGKVLRAMELISERGRNHLLTGEDE